jgi:sugar-specific transcriptional regulator TrmB
MSTDKTADEVLEEAVSVLQQLGLKEYEAKCFVGLSRVSSGTAKRLSEITEVPRTRIYDAIRVLEAQGLVEIQHTSPQQFRAVPLKEGIETLRDQYRDRVDRLETLLRGLDEVQEDTDEPVQEVWSLSGESAVENRIEQLIEDADSEIVFVLGHPSLLTEDLATALDTVDPTTDLLIGTVTESLQDRVREAVPNAQTFVSGLEWLDHNGDDVAIGRLLLVDRSTILVSTFDADHTEEHAVFGGGFKNGLVVISRRLMAKGLIPTRDPSIVGG